YLFYPRGPPPRGKKAVGRAATNPPANPEMFPEKVSRTEQDPTVPRDQENLNTGTCQTCELIGDPVPVHVNADHTDYRTVRSASWRGKIDEMNRVVIWPARLRK